jgi:hypothetical protein
LVKVPNGPVFHFRELTPRDFYLAQVLRQSDRSQFELIVKLLVDDSILDEASASDTRKAIIWAVENLVNETVLTVENWLEIAYHMCKQRWDQSIDWLETQPMSKINLMIEIIRKHADEQEKAMKKNARKKR